MNKINVNMRKERVFLLYMDIAVSIVTFMSILLLDNSQQSLKYLGIIIILISFYQLLKVRLNTELLVLFGLITYINISVALGDLLQIAQVLGVNTLEWQMSVRMSHYNALGAKSIIIIMSILNIMINRRYLNRVIYNASEPIKRKENNCIFFVGFIVLFVFWYFGYGSSIGETYHSNTRTIYEYSIIVFIVVWFYSGKSKFKRNLLYFYAVIYILQALSRGDRSSAFPMLVILFLIQNYKINLKILFTLVIGGILASNIISVYRVAFSVSQIKELYLSRYGMTAFLSDTVSQSYYTGISILNVRDMLSNTSAYFLDFLGGVVFGGGFRNADVGAISFNYLLNKGGGFYFSWFYFWFGFVGVVLASLLLGYIIRKFFSSTNNYVKLYQLTLVAMSFRWYLYTPFVLFRSVLFIFTILLLISSIVEKLTTRKMG